MTAAAMSSYRSHLLAVAVITLVFHVSVVSLGALRACWGSEHTHAGVPVDDCAMHHRADSASGEHAHHMHGSPATQTDEDRERISCRCSNDGGSPYVGPSWIVGPVLSLSYIARPRLLIAQDKQVAADLRFPPLAPPPRSTFSSRS